MAIKKLVGGSEDMSTVPSALPTRPCVAVLPLQNFSAHKPETDYIVDGMTEVLIAELAKNRTLKVVSRTTVMQFKESRRPLRQIARELGERLGCDPDVVDTAGLAHDRAHHVGAGRHGELHAPGAAPKRRAAARVRRTPLVIPKADAYAITNVEIHPVEGQTVAGGTIVMKNGRIESLGSGPAPDGVTVVDGTGLSAYPGMIDTGTAIGLTEIGSVHGTRDENEIGAFQPDLLSSTALNPHSEHVPVARANGLTTVLSGQGGGLVAGQASLIRLSGWVPGRELEIIR